MKAEHIIRDRHWTESGIPCSATLLEEIYEPDGQEGFTSFLVVYRGRTRGESRSFSDEAQAKGYFEEITEGATQNG